jgi:type II secretory pathway pseudopilin PulG
MPRGDRVRAGTGFRSASRSTKRDVASRCGFTLLEVTLAVAIVGTALFSIALAIGRCMDAARLSSSYTTAHDLAEAKLMEFNNPTNFFLGVTTGDFDTNWPGFQWQREIVVDDSQLDALYRQTVTVSWKDRGKDYDVTLTTMLYNPNVTSEGTSTGDAQTGASAPRSSTSRGGPRR